MRTLPELATTTITAVMVSPETLTPGFFLTFVGPPCLLYNCDNFTAELLWHCGSLLVGSCDALYFTKLLKMLNAR